MTQKAALQRSGWVRVALAVAAGWALSLALAGCAAGPTAQDTNTTTAPGATQPQATGYAGPAISVKAMIGTQALTGASVQLYAAGATGNGSAGVPLLTPALNTDSSGAASVSAGYECPSASAEIYAVVRGGRAGAAAANSAIALLSVLGPCSRAPASVVVNEVTTAAAVYALAPFLSAGGNAGASATNATGLSNGFDTAAALANVSTGTSPGASFAANGSSPAATVNTLANVIHACTASGPAAGGACGMLFSATTRTGATAPSDTLDAAWNLVRSPAANVASLYALAAGAPAFSPMPGAAPLDFTLSIDYSGGGLNQPSGLGIDGLGNVWVASYGNVASMFSPLGKPLFANGISGSGLSASYGLAVDAANNAWIPNEPSLGITGNSVSVLNSSGQSVAGAQGFTGGGLNYPVAVAMDTDGSAWVMDYGNSHLTHLSGTGQALSGATGYASPQIAFPVAAAVDGSHNVWVANQSSGTITRVAPDGSQFTSFACCNGPSGVAIDESGNVWVANFYGDSISEVAASGLIVSSGYTGGGLAHPQGIAVDGGGNVWVANYRGSSISELAGAAAGPVAAGTALSPAQGLGGHTAMVQAYAIAVDASGNVWVSNLGSDTITEFVGLAVPVRTPTIGPAIAP